MSDAPIVAEDVLASPMLGEREKAYEREGIRSLLAVPLNVRGELTGTLVFYYRSPHKFSEVDLRVATALSNLTGSAIGTAELYQVLKANDRRKDEFLAMLATSCATRWPPSPTPSRWPGGRTTGRAASGAGRSSTGRCGTCPG